MSTALADAPVVAPESRLAILGDSLSTGAATHPALVFDTERLWAVFQDQTLVAPKRSDIPSADRFQLPETLAAPQRLWPSPREYSGSFEWVLRNSLQSLSRRFLDTAQYSWGYLAAAGLGIEPANVLIAAEDGARTAQIPRHIDRVLEANDGRLPERILLFYSGNDLCAPAVNFVPNAEEYAADLSAGIEYIMRVASSGGTPRGTDVYVVGFLGVLQLLHSPDILNKKVFAFGETVTCKELRDHGYGPGRESYRPQLPVTAWYFGELMPPNPAAFCPTLFGRGTVGGETQEQLVSTLANRIRDFREEQRKQVDAANLRLSASAEKFGQVSSLRFHYVDATTALTFTGDDIAGDCFHLSTGGQAKVADAVLSQMQKP
jgi:hypothetical protein